MPYTDFTDVLEDDADAIRYIDGSTSSIVFTDMPNRILGINGLRFGVSDSVGSWVGRFLPYLTGSEYITDMSYWFYNGKLGDNPDFSNFSTAAATNMSHMFHSTSASTLDLSSFDTSNVTDMSYMLYYCGADSIDISNFDTSSVTNMSYMLSGLQSRAYGTLDFSNWDTSSVTDMSYMFDALRGDYRVDLDLSSFNTSSVTNMERMFNTRTTPPALWTIDFSNWDTSSVTNMKGMFFSFRGIVWIPSTFVATAVIDADKKPFYLEASAYTTEIYTDAADAATQGWGTVDSTFVIHYNSTHQDFLNAISQ